MAELGEQVLRLRNQNRAMLAALLISLPQAFVK